MGEDVPDPCGQMRDEGKDVQELYTGEADVIPTPPSPISRAESIMISSGGEAENRQDVEAESLAATQAYEPSCKSLFRYVPGQFIDKTIIVEDDTLATQAYESETLQYVSVAANFETEPATQCYYVPTESESCATQLYPSAKHNDFKPMSLSLATRSSDRKVSSRQNLITHYDVFKTNSTPKSNTRRGSYSSSRNSPVELPATQIYEPLTSNVANLQPSLVDPKTKRKRGQKESTQKVAPPQSPSLPGNICRTNQLEAKRARRDRVVQSIRTAERTTTPGTATPCFSGALDCDELVERGVQEFPKVKQQSRKTPGQAKTEKVSLSTGKSRFPFVRKKPQRQMKGPVVSSSASSPVQVETEIVTPARRTIVVGDSTPTPPKRSGIGVETLRRRLNGKQHPGNIYLPPADPAKQLFQHDEDADLPLPIIPEKKR
jgi:hypothetical protein